MYTLIKAEFLLGDVTIVKMQENCKITELLASKQPIESLDSSYDFECQTPSVWNLHENFQAVNDC